MSLTSDIMYRMKTRYGKSSERNLKLVVVLGRSIQALERAVTPGIREAGMTPTQFAVLEILYHKGPLTIKEIIRDSLSTSGNITVVIENLVKNGWVGKCRGVSDSRTRVISLTEEGKVIIEDFFPKHIADLEKVFAALTVAEKETLTELLKKFGKGIERS